MDKYWFHSQTVIPYSFERCQVNLHRAPDLCTASLWNKKAANPGLGIGESSDSIAMDQILISVDGSILLQKWLYIHAFIYCHVTNCFFAIYMLHDQGLQSKILWIDVVNIL